MADGAEGIHIAAMVDALRQLGHDVIVDGVLPGTGATAKRTWVERVRSVSPRALFELASVAYNVREYASVRRAIRRFRPDLLYKRHSRFDVAALLAARHLGVRSVLEVNALFTGNRYQAFEPLALPAIARGLERTALRLATLVIAVSSPLARQGKELAGVDVKVVPNGVDPVRFDPGRVSGARVRDEYGLGDATVIGWVGILREWHGLERLLQATAGLSNSRLFIVGDGPARGALESEAQRLGVQSRLVISGRVPHDAMPEFIAAMDITVVADERTGVASPMKLLEYMAMGVPVVAPRIENISDLVEEGKDALLFEPGNAEDLSARLRQLASDPALREALGRAARSKIERQRNWRAVAREVLELLRCAPVSQEVNCA